MTSIIELITHINNYFQTKPLQQLCIPGESAQIYLSDYTVSTIDNIEGIFTVLGSIRKGCREMQMHHTNNPMGHREEYKISFNKPATHPRGSFKCSCPDYTFNSRKKSIVCKHICFIVCRFGSIYSVDFFNNSDKQLTQEQHNIILEKAVEFANREIQELYSGKQEQLLQQEQLQEKFAVSYSSQVDDICPICYDNMQDEHSLLKCPTCSNHIHKECMTVWLERNKSCILCRSTIWRVYTI